MKLIADTHTHTTASGHAYSTVTENALAASECGLSFMCVTDHAPAMPGAPHYWHFVNQRVLPECLHGVRILRGVEVNIVNESGEFDLPLYAYLGLDWVNASLHEAVLKPQSKAFHTQALVSAINSQLVDAIAHPGNPSFPIDIEEVVMAAATAGVAIELNNSSLNGSRKGSEPNCLNIAALAKEKGAWVTTGSDAHFSNAVGKLDSVRDLITKVGLSPDQVVTSDVDLFQEYQEQRHRVRLRHLEGMLET